ncbi:hypothetical protein BDW42DRAFT_117176 [Aspergillus taichungensis]|uniref:Hydrophobin n=1 Tax=Aspergillus taichungensis TaxID=482145 RepID=A0A2J5HS42_9EURO|nr:hypothetical protein BDW42DRAFT_117176 [Aspergillus taichungensis]
MNLLAFLTLTLTTTTLAIADPSPTTTLSSLANASSSALASPENDTCPPSRRSKQCCTSVNGISDSIFGKIGKVIPILKDVKITSTAAFNCKGMKDDDPHDECLSDIMCCDGSPTVCFFLSPPSLSSYLSSIKWPYIHHIQEPSKMEHPHASLKPELMYKKQQNDESSYKLHCKPYDKAIQDKAKDEKLSEDSPLAAALDQASSADIYRNDEGASSTPVSSPVVGSSSFVASAAAVATPTPGEG